MYKIYGQNSCIYCEKAKNLIDCSGEEYDYLNVNKEAIKDSGMNTVPIIYHNGKLIGGYKELSKYLLEG